MNDDFMKFSPFFWNSSDMTNSKGILHIRYFTIIILIILLIISIIIIIVIIITIKIIIIIF